jgi:hypothetical protein
MIPGREELALTVDEAQWEWLRAHLERGVLIIVSPDLDLVEAGMNVAADDVATIKTWIDAGRLAKPSAEQIAQWDAIRHKKFMMLIISPYILIQEKTAQIQ